MENLRQVPIGIQSFKAMRDKTYSYVYVDKSHFIWQLQKRNSVYFLSRPRRFGKSLFLSMLKAYFQGEKELFNGLEIEKIKKENKSDWESYPVLYLDLSGKAYKEKEELNEVLNANIEKWKDEFGITLKFEESEIAFSEIILAIYKKTGKQVVVLVDEYDQPLLSTINDEELNNYYRAILKGFYSVLKSSNEYLRFSFITGVTKFSSVTIFSGLNNLYDITLMDEYSEICGITEKEMLANFELEIKELAEKKQTTYEHIIEKLKKHYDGYHFSKNGVGIYNPFSLCNALASKEIEDYWFRTGTPTFLVEFLANNNFDVPTLDDGEIVCNAQELTDYRMAGDNIIPLLFQSGYLTITGYDEGFNAYTLGFPNDEVRYAFLGSLIKEYTKKVSFRDNSFSIYSFTRLMQKGEIEEVLQRIKALMASLPYDSLKKDEIALREYNVQTMIYLIFRLMGQFVKAEVHSSRGRSDVEVETKENIYIFEFKMGQSADRALQQIEEKGYHEKHKASNKKIVSIGVEIQEDGKNLKEWKVSEII